MVGKRKIKGGGKGRAGAKEIKKRVRKNTTRRRERKHRMNVRRLRETSKRDEESKKRLITVAAWSREVGRRGALGG